MVRADSLPLKRPSIRHKLAAANPKRGVFFASLARRTSNAALPSGSSPISLRSASTHSGAGGGTGTLVVIKGAPSANGRCCNRFSSASASCNFPSHHEILLFASSTATCVSLAASTFFAAAFLAASSGFRLSLTLPSAARSCSDKVLAS